MNMIQYILSGAILLVIGCILWIGTQIVWLRIEGKIKADQVEKLFDKAYSQGIRTFARLISDIRKGGGDDVQM